MRRGRWVLLLMVVLAAAGAAGWLSLHPVQPVYQGKPLSYWLKGYEPSPSGGTNPNGLSWTDAQQAVRAMGGNAVPNLMRMLRHGDLKGKEWLWGLLQRQHILRVKPLPRNPRWIAVPALRDLGPAASNAVPELIEMFETDPSPFGQTAPLAVLAGIGPPAKAAVPVLLQRGVTHTNWLVRQNAIFALRKIHPESKMVVPVFAKCLNDPDVTVRAEAAKSLGDYGKEAREAAPALAYLYRQESAVALGTGSPSMLAGESMTISKWMARPTWMPGLLDAKTIEGEALMDIDPEAATKAGVTVTNQ